jgi:hypothetical protein
MFQIDLSSSSGKLLLYLPGGRTLEIEASAGGLEYIRKILRDHHEGIRNQRGYIGLLPTQHRVDKDFADQFLRDKAKKAAQETANGNVAKAGKLGIDLGRLEINL